MVNKARQRLEGAIDSICSKNDPTSRLPFLPYFKMALLVAVITVGTKLFNSKKLKTRASLCLISVEETTSASNQLLTFSPLSFGHPGLPGVSKTMEDNGGKLKKLEKGSA